MGASFKEKHFYQKKLAEYKRRQAEYREYLRNVSSTITKVNHSLKKIEKLEKEIEAVKDLVEQFTDFKIHIRKDTIMNESVLGLFYRYCFYELHIDYTFLVRYTNNKDVRKARYWANKCEEMYFRLFKQFVKNNDNGTIIHK